MVFPEGILFDYENDHYRTLRVNTLFSIIHSVSEVLIKNKKGTKLNKTALSRKVLEVGIEPTLPKELDFESSASTNSATRAYSDGKISKIFFSSH